jgi:DNA polymerase-3 subunit delta'
MSFEDIKGQEEARKFFQSALSSNRLAFFYIFAGPDGVGKGLFARELTKALFCERGTLRTGPPFTGTLNNCSACSACLRIDSGNHPDVNWLDVRENAELVSVKDARPLQDALYLKPAEGPFKVAIVRRAERLSTAAANSLLKTLEEPPPRALLILLAAALEALLATVRSRGQVVRFYPLPPEVVEKMLTQKGLGEEASRYLAAISQGSPGRALEIAEEEGFEEKRNLLEAFAHLSKENDLEVAQEVYRRAARDTKTSVERRRRLLNVITYLLYFYRDVYLLKEKDQGLLVNEDQADLVRRLKERLKSSALEKIITILLETRRNLLYHSNQHLTLSVLTKEIANLTAS